MGALSCSHAGAVLCRTAPCRGVVSARLQLQPCRPSPPSRPPDPKGSQKSRWSGSPTLQRVDQEPTEQQPHSRGRDGAQWARSPSCCLQGAPRSAPSLPPFSFSCRELSPGPVPPCLCLICLILGCLIGNQLNIKHILTAAGPPSAACRPRGLSAHHLFCDAQRWARSPAPPHCPLPPHPCRGVPAIPPPGLGQRAPGCQQHPLPHGWALGGGSGGSAAPAALPELNDAGRGLLLSPCSENSLGLSVPFATPPPRHGERSARGLRGAGGVAGGAGECVSHGHRAWGAGRGGPGLRHPPVPAYTELPGWDAVSLCHQNGCPLAGGGGQPGQCGTPTCQPAAAFYNCPSCPAGAQIRLRPPGPPP